MTEAIEGIPEYWELVRIGVPKWSEHYINNKGHVRQCNDSPYMHSNDYHPIVRKKAVYYIAKKDLSFMDESMHIKGRCYFPSPETEAYFDVMGKNYEKRVLETTNVGGRTIASPNHDFGYTRTYLKGWMESQNYDFSDFQLWMRGQGVGVTEDNETIYFYGDVAVYLAKAKVN